MALVRVSAKYCCWITLGEVVPGVVLLPEKPLLHWAVGAQPLERLGATRGSDAAVSADWIWLERGMPAAEPVASSMKTVLGV